MSTIFLPGTVGADYVLKDGKCYRFISTVTAGSVTTHDDEFLSCTDCNTTPCTSSDPSLLVTVSGSTTITIDWMGQTWNLPGDSGLQKEACPHDYQLNDSGDYTATYTTYYGYLQYIFKNKLQWEAWRRYENLAFPANGWDINMTRRYARFTTYRYYLSFPTYPAINKNRTKRNRFLFKPDYGLGGNSIHSENYFYSRLFTYPPYSGTNTYHTTQLGGFLVSEPLPGNNNFRLSSGFFDNSIVVTAGSHTVTYSWKRGRGW